MKILSIEDARKFTAKKTVVIITGVTGQDGSLMVDYLLKNTAYELFGGARRLSVANHDNIRHLEKENRFHLINFDLTDAHSISQTISQLNPSYFINFAAQSFVKSSWDFPAQTWETNTTSMIHILESIRLHCPICRFYNAGSSEEFGNVIYSPQDENHPLRPRSPYGASKAAARQLVKVYRESYSLYALQGWLFNHECSRRGEEFVTRKITKAVARIAKGSKEPLELGNINTKRDWSDADDCVDAVWRMLNQEKSSCLSWAASQQESATLLDWTRFVAGNIKEYVVSSGESHSIREFVERAFKIAGIQAKWMGGGVDEIFGDEQYGILVKINPIFYRPVEVEFLMGNPSCIMHDLGWKPKTTFNQLVEKMVLHDMESLDK